MDVSPRDIRDPRDTPVTEPEVRLVAVVATYDRLPEMRKTLTRLLAEPCVAVIVVDNGSTDGTRDWLSGHKDPRLHTIFTQENTGGAGGFERGMQAARDLFDPDWVVVMDDDARPDPGAFDVFFAEARRGRWDVLAAAVYYPGGRICEMNRPSCNPFWYPGTLVKTVLKALLGQGRGGFHIPDQAYTDGQIRPIDAASFVGMFVSRNVMQAIGLPDGRLFIYGDDVAYSLRARKRDFTIGFAPEIRFEHACSSFGVRHIYHPYWKIYYNYRNRLFTYRKAAGWFSLLVVPVFIAKWLLEGRHYGKARRVFYRLLLLGLKDGLTGRKWRPHDEIMALADVAGSADTQNKDMPG
jgi:rhamnopyranosyl-N-acetylglucosaminyl-diphospho-decaprenol beta-1,3/1,4-galactofuranosyltransferase